MGSDTLSEMAAEFDSVDGIFAYEPEPTDERVIVKVEDESAVGEFFRLKRELDADMSAITRDDLSYTVLDAFLHR